MHDHQSEAEAYLKKCQDAFAAVTGIRVIEQVPESYVEAMLQDEVFVSRIKIRHGLHTREQVKALLSETSPGGISRIRYIADRITQTSPPSLRDSLRTMPVGYLPTSDLNAQPLSHPNGYSIIVLHYGIVTVLYFVVCAFLGTIRTPGSEAKWTMADAAVWITQIITLTALGEAYFGLNPIPRFDDPYRITAFGDFQDNICAFILGHEFAHKILEHDKERSTYSVGPQHSGGEPSLQFLLRTHEQEFEADRLGVQIALLPFTDAPSSESQIVYEAVVVFFHILTLLEIVGGPSPLAKHPSADFRRRSFNEQYERNWEPSMRDEIAMVDEFFDFIRPRLRSAIDELLPSARKEFKSRRHSV
jgi:hypothetical protein